MAPFLSRILAIRKKFSTNEYDKKTDHIKECARTSDFSGSGQIRVLLFRERHGQDRGLLFDSKFVSKRGNVPPDGRLPQIAVSRSSLESSIEQSFKLNNVPEKEYIYEWRKSSPDEQMLREMIFGSVSVSYHGTALKVHSIRSPPQIMMSAVFPAPSMFTFQLGDSELEDSGKFQRSEKEMAIPQRTEKSPHLAHSVPITVSAHNGCYDSDTKFEQSQDDYVSLPTNFLSSDDKTSSLPRSFSYNSLQRRLLRNKATSIELGLQTCGDSQEFQAIPAQHRVKLGLSIVISLNPESDQESYFHDFLFTHISLIESHVMRLKNTVIKAYLNRKKFIHMMFQGSLKLQKAIEDLYTAPRLQFPDWLTAISATNHHDVSSIFLRRFVKVMKEYDKKETNFFLSTVLTAVLTYHLAWVPTVVPADAELSLDRSSHKRMPPWVDMLAKSRPYNPLWVQLCDLYGAVSYPFKTAKTVITGSKRDVIMQFLQILSYFIRCSDVVEQGLQKEDNLPLSFERMKCSTCEKTSGQNENGAESSLIKMKDDEIQHDSSYWSMDRTTMEHSETENNFSTDKTNVVGENVANTTNMSRDTTSDSTVPKCPYECVSIPCCSTCSITLDSLGYGSMSKNCMDIQAILSNYESAFPCKDSVSRTCWQCTYDSNLKFSNFSLSLGEFCKLRKSSSLKNIHEPCKYSKLCMNEDSITNHSCAHVYKHLSEIVCLNTHKESKLVLCKCSISNGDIKNMKEVDHRTVRRCESDESKIAKTDSCLGNVPCHNCLNLLLTKSHCKCINSEGIEEYLLPRSKACGQSVNSSLYKSFGWSLMAGISDHYLMDFCLQGVQGSKEITHDEIKDDLLNSIQVHVLGEPVSEAVCILADTDSWSVQVMSGSWTEDDKLSCSSTSVAMSSLVSQFCETILRITELNLPPEMCIIHLEDRLQELYFRSLSLTEYLCNNKNPATLGTVASSLNLGISDIPLLLAIATTHSPHLRVLNQ